jgi:hypothetical protein
MLLSLFRSRCLTHPLTLLSINLLPAPNKKWSNTLSTLAERVACKKLHLRAQFNQQLSQDSITRVQWEALCTLNKSKVRAGHGAWIFPVNKV